MNFRIKMRSSMLLCFSAVVLFSFNSRAEKDTPLNNNYINSFNSPNLEKQLSFVEDLKIVLKNNVPAGPLLDEAMLTLSQVSMSIESGERDPNLIRAVLRFIRRVIDKIMRGRGIDKIISEINKLIEDHNIDDRDWWRY